MTRRLVFAVVALLAMAGGAWAHSFDVAIVAPLSGARAGAGQAALQGFRVATKERDGHAGEESDGHLGGLDVYMRPVDATGDVLAAIGALAPPRFVLVIGDDALRDRIAAALPDIAVMGPGALPDPAARAADDFAQRYRADYGSDPDLSAEAGYNAARRIELAVRPLGESGDADALRAALAATAAGIAW